MKQINELMLFVLALVLFFVASQSSDWTGIFIIGSALIIAWVWPHKNKKRETILSRHMKLRKNGGSHTADEWLALCVQHKWRCVSCGNKGHLTKDHIVSVDQGGGDSIGNIQPLCKSCNSRKKNRTFKYGA